MRNESNHKTVLMCCSDLSYRGGMVTVVRNYLSSKDWDEFDIRFVPTHVQGGKLKVALHFAATYPKLSRMFKKHEVDLVHLHVAERGSFFRKALIAKSAKRHGIPVIFHHHAAEFMQFYDGLDNRGKDYVRESFELVDLNIVLSNAIKKQLSSLFPKARFEVIENAVSTFSENPYSDSSRNIVFMGRVGDRKGAFDLIKASITLFLLLVKSGICCFVAMERLSEPRMRFRVMVLMVEQNVLVGFLEKPKTTSFEKLV